MLGYKQIDYIEVRSTIDMILCFFPKIDPIGIMIFSNHVVILLFNEIKHMLMYNCVDQEDETFQEIIIGWGRNLEIIYRRVNFHILL